MLALSRIGQLGADTPPPDPALPPPPDIQTIRVRALSLWNALLIGVVTGFAVSLGTVVFQRAARVVSGRAPTS